MRSLFEGYFKPLVRFAANYVSDTKASEDIIQDVFLSLIEGRKNFESTDHLKSYLYIAVKNACLNHIRSKEIKNRHVNAYSKGLADETNFIDNVLEQEVIHILIREINDLPTSYRSVFLLQLEGDGNQEIAAKLGISIETVKSYKKKGKLILKKRLDQYTSLPLLFLLLGI